MRDRLIDILMDRFWEDDTGHIVNYFTIDESENIADYLLENGVIVPLCEVGSKVYRIDCTNRGKFCGITDYKCKECPYQSVEIIEGEVLAFHFIKKFCLKVRFNNFIDFFRDDEVYYTKKEAEQALKEGVK